MTEASKSGLPTWLNWVLGIVFLPIGIVWGLVVMWRRGTFNAVARIGLTVVGLFAVFMLGAVGVGMVQGAATGTTPRAAVATASSIASCGHGPSHRHRAGRRQP